VGVDAAFRRELEWDIGLIEDEHGAWADPGFEHLRPTADLLGVKYLLLGFPQPGLEHLGQRHRLLLYRNPQALPRAWVVGAADAAVDQRQEMIEAIAPSFSRRERALLDAPPPIPLATPGEIPSKITFEEPRPETLRLRTRTAAPGMLVVSEVYDPDWQATMDGEKVRVYRANHLVRAVYLPPGEHIVEFRYDNLAYQMGFRISLFMAALWTVLALRVWSRGRRWRVHV
jgi:hypothetical protein